MKGFKEFIEEDHGRDAKSLGGDGGHGNQYGRWGQEPVHMGVHRIEDPNVLQRLNAHIGLVNTREYIDPRSALEQVQNALMRLGYHFDYNMTEMPNEENIYPLRRFGGRKGFLDMDAVVKEDDGIENTVGESMVLRVEFVQDPDSARYEVTAQIVPASLFDEDEDVQPEAIRPNRASVASTAGDSDGINMGESIVYMGEDVSISTGQEKGQGTFEVTFDFRGGPTKKQAQKFALAAQKRLAGAQFTPNRKGTSEKVVVTVKASSARDAQVKARNVLDGVKESLEEAKDRPRQKTKIGKKDKNGEFQVFVFSDKTKKFIPQGQPFLRRPLAVQFADKLAVNENFIENQITEAQKFIVSFPSKANRNQALADVQKLPSGLRTTASSLFPGAGPANGVFFSVLDNNIQTRDLMKLIKKNKGRVVSQKTEQTFNEALLSRTFAFPTADARNRIEKLFALANGESITTSDKGKGKFKFTVSGMLRSVQIDRILNSVKQLKGKLAEEQVDEALDLSRTFAFNNSNARDKIEKLLSLASGDIVTTSDKGKGQFKFTVTAMLKRAQIDRVFNSVKQLKGIVEENSPESMADNAVRKAIRERAERLHERDPFRDNQLKVARDTLKMNPVFRKVMGGPSRVQAIKIFLDKGTPADKKLAKRAMNEGVQIFPADPRFSGPIAPKSSKFGQAFNVEIGFSADDWKRLAPLVRKAAAKAKLKTFDIRSDKVIRVVVKTKDAKQAQKQVSDLVDGVKKSIGVREQTKDDNTKELARTRKDNKIASGFNEAVANLTVVAIKGNKVVGQLRFVEKKEVKDVIAFMKKEHPGAKVSVENKSGKIISVESMMFSSVREQLSKRKKKTTSY